MTPPRIVATFMTLVACAFAPTSFAGPDDCGAGLVWDPDIGSCSGPPPDPVSQGAVNIIFESNDYRAGVVISQNPAGGCRSGFVFRPEYGGCTTTSNQSESSSRSCSYTSGGVTYIGGTQSRSRSRTRYTHQNGGILYGNWGAWGSYGSCKGGTPQTPPPPSGPKPGDGFSIDRTISALICGSSDNGYYDGASSTTPISYRNQLISYYRNMGIAGRCPEHSGYVYWMNEWRQNAVNAAIGPFNAAGGSGAGNDWSQWINDYMGMNGVWIPTREAIKTSADQNDESGQGGVIAGNDNCQRTANKIYGTGKVVATYVLKSGNKCTVKSVN